MSNFSSMPLTVLHTHISDENSSAVGRFLHDKLGEVGCFIEQTLWHGLVDTLKLVPILFLTYLLMEFIEHKASERVYAFMKRAGGLGPVVAGAFGALPQCGFSAAGANLYTGRVISLGTLIAVFLSTSDEMLPILIAGNVKGTTAALIVAYKIAVGAVMGLIVNLVMKLMNKKSPDIDIDQICDNDNCRCERGIVPSALHHTLTVSLFVLIITVVINGLLFFINEEQIAGGILRVPFVSHILCAVAGLIPNCAASVALTKLAMGGIISSGAMISGLFSGAGVGLLILFRMNRHIKENIVITLLLVLIGTVFGFVADFIPFLAI